MEENCLASEAYRLRREMPDFSLEIIRDFRSGFTLDFMSDSTLGFIWEFFGQPQKHHGTPARDNRKTNDGTTPAQPRGSPGNHAAETGRRRGGREGGRGRAGRRTIRVCASASDATLTRSASDGTAAFRALQPQALDGVHERGERLAEPRVHHQKVAGLVARVALAHARERRASAAGCEVTRPRGE